MAARTRSKAASAKEELEQAPAVVEPAVDVDPEPQPEPEVEIVGPDEPLTDDRQPGTAPLEAPAPAPAGAGIDLSNPFDIADGTLAAHLVEHTSELDPRREFVDARTGEKVTSEQVFVKEFPLGSTLICQIRLLENVWHPGLAEPVSRLVLGAGARISAANAERIITQLDRQAALDALAKPAEDAETV